MSGTFEDRIKLRAYLARNRVNGKMNGPQQAAWDALNEVDDLVHLLRLVRKHGMSLEREIEIDLVLKRNSPDWKSKRV